MQSNACKYQTRLEMGGRNGSCRIKIYCAGLWRESEMEEDDENDET
jgi:hypothetical protein